ncbi:hypothetical protein IT157_10840 [bacterium]|jgi:hypothetical protein|nr:hypothetical protein [bacterium]
MSHECNEFTRQLGCLRIHIQHLEQRLRKNDLTGIELEAGEVERTLIQLLRLQRTLPRHEQQTLRRKFVELRQQALRTLEISRRILDESMKAMIDLIDAVEEAAGLNTSGGKSILIDRKA